jgi:hypothetical protein
MDKLIAFRLARVRGINLLEHKIHRNAGAVTAMESMELILMDAPCHVQTIQWKCAEMAGAIPSTRHCRQLQ